MAKSQSKKGVSKSLNPTSEGDVKKTIIWVIIILFMGVFSSEAQEQEEIREKALELQREAWALEYDGTTEEVEKALSLYDEALKLTPDNGTLSFLRHDCSKKLAKKLIIDANTLIEKHEWDDALSRFNKAKEFSSSPEIQEGIKRCKEGKRYEKEQLSRGIVRFRGNWINIEEKDMILEKEKREQEEAQRRAKIAKENLIKQIKKDETKREEEARRRQEEERKRKEEEEKQFSEELERIVSLYKNIETYTFDKTYAANEFDYVISFVEKRKRLISENGYDIVPDLGKVFIVIGVHFLNGSKEKEFCSPSKFILIDTENTPYDYDSSTFSIPFGLEGVNLYPGTKKEGVIVFQILEGHNPARLIYEVGYDNVIEKKITRVE